MRDHLLALTLFCSLAAVPAAAQPSANDEAGATAAVRAFQNAINSGNAAAAAELIAEDALMIEGGAIETRTEYVTNHLPADIDFEKAVTAKRTPLKVVVRGDAAWAITEGDFSGTFQNRPVNFLGLELMVLSREPAGWRIRAIHWSSRQRRAAN